MLDFCRSIGWDEFCLSTEGLDPGQGLALIATLADARDTHAERLARAAAAVRSRLLDSVPSAVSALVGEAG